MAVASSNMNTVVGVFESPQQAQRAVMELKAAGFSDDQIGVVSRNEEGQVVGKEKTDSDAGEAATGAAAGAATGAGLGALWGLGIIAGVLPGIGPAIVGGTLGAILSSAAAGAAAVGIGGALIGMGIPEEEATYYEGEYKRGRTLVTVHAGAKVGAAAQVIERHGGKTRQSKMVGI